MQIFGVLLGLFLGPRGCIGTIVFLAVEFFVGVRFGSKAAWWVALAMLILAFLPIGIRNGRAGLMRVVQAVLAVCGAGWALLALVQLTIGRLTDGHTWMTVAMAVGCWFAFRWVGRMVDRTDAASAAVNRTAS
jgi:hypothetical protein